MSCSRLYRTPAWPPGAGPDFVNAAVVLHCRGALGGVLSRLHAQEAAAGRVRGARWAPRVLDLDLLGAGNRVAPDLDVIKHWMHLPPQAQTVEAPDQMIVPHPRLQDRAFVLIPLMDVASDWRHPVTGRTVRSMVSGLAARERREIRAIGPVDGVVNCKSRA